MGFREPQIPASFVGQNVCIPETYIQQLGDSFHVPPDKMPKVLHDQQVFNLGLAMFDEQENAIVFPTFTTYEIVAYHEFMHFLGWVRYKDALAIQREEHEVFTFGQNTEVVEWCGYCRTHKK